MPAHSQETPVAFNSTRRSSRLVTAHRPRRADEPVRYADVLGHNNDNENQMEEHHSISSDNTDSIINVSSREASPRHSIPTTTQHNAESDLDHDLDDNSSLSSSPRVLVAQIRDLRGQTILITSPRRYLSPAQSVAREGGHTASDDSSVQHESPRMSTALPQAVTPDSSPPSTGIPAIIYLGINVTQNLTVVCEHYARVPWSSPHVREIIQSLKNAAGLAGRQIRQLEARPNFTNMELYVGRSDYPTNVDGNDFMSDEKNFVEMGRYHHALVSSKDKFIVEAIPDSDTRTTFLRHRRLDSNLPVYVIYVYEAENIDNATAADSESSLPATRPSISLIPPPLTVAVSSNPPPNTVASALSARYSQNQTNLTQLVALQYGSAYNHCLKERFVMQIADSLNIRTSGPGGRVFVQGVSIQREDIAEWMGITPSTFTGFVTEFKLARSAHQLLRLQAPVRILPPYHIAFKETLDAMLGTAILDPPHFGAQLALPIETAINIKISPFMRTVKEIITVYDASQLIES